MIHYDRYEAEITPAKQIYWQLCQEFGKSEVDTWDDETYLEAYAALIVIGKTAKKQAEEEAAAAKQGKGG